VDSATNAPPPSAICIRMPVSITIAPAMWKIR